MGDITVPHSLSSANAALNLADSFAKLLDPAQRKSIADDIKAYNALNDTEAKKAEDARMLIKQHSDILNETKNLFDRVVKERKDLELDKISFKTEMEAERAKISIGKSEANAALDAAKKLHDQAVDIQNKAYAKESDLQKEKDEHLANMKKFADDKKDLENKRKEVFDFQKQVLDLDAQTKAKVESLKRFNF